MKNTIKWCAPRFNTSRMVAEYTRKFYNPAGAKWRYLTAEAMARVRALSMWKANVKNAWSDISIEKVDVQIDDGKKISELNVREPQLEVGGQLKVTAEVKMGRLTPDDVAVEIYHGKTDTSGNIIAGEVVRMDFASCDEIENICVFGGAIPCRASGQHGFAIRVMPKHADQVETYEPGMILWESRNSS